MEEKQKKKELLSPRTPRNRDQPRPSEAVLLERPLRFELFPSKSRERFGGVKGVLLDVDPRTLEKQFPSAKIKRRSAFDEFVNKLYPTHTQVRLLWSAEPFPKYKETILEVSHPTHLLPASWKVLAQGLPLPQDLAETMVCCDQEGRVRRPMGAFVALHMPLRPVNPDVLFLPPKDGAFYLLREPRELAEHHVMVSSASIPVSVQVRLNRSLLARAAWIKLRALKTQRVLRLDTCRNLDNYTLGPLEDCVVKWHACRVGSCSEDALRVLGQRLEEWLKRDTDDHVYAKRLQVHAADLTAERALWLFVLLQFYVWVVLTHGRMRDYPVEVSDASPEVKAVLEKIQPFTLKVPQPQVAATVAHTYELLQKRDPQLLPTMKLIFL